MNVDTQKDKFNHQEQPPFPEAGVDQAKMTADQSDSSGPSSLEGRLRELEDELQDYKDRYLRNLADVENMRKRHERERADLLKYASEKLLQDMLPVLDSFEKATQVSGSVANDPVLEGVRMVHKQFLQILENHGLKLIDAQGKAFDPNLHQAIQRVETDEVRDETVKDEYQKGYTLNGRLVRPSMVSVFVPRSSGQPEIS